MFGDIDFAGLLGNSISEAKEDTTHSQSKDTSDVSGENSNDEDNSDDDAWHRIAVASGAKDKRNPKQPSKRRKIHHAQRSKLARRLEHLRNKKRRHILCPGGIVACHICPLKRTNLFQERQ